MANEVRVPHDPAPSPRRSKGQEMKRVRFGKRSLASGVAVLAALATAGGVA
jgi:hypothetical protein